MLELLSGFRFQKSARPRRPPRPFFALVLVAGTLLAFPRYVFPLPIPVSPTSDAMDWVIWRATPKQASSVRPADSAGSRSRARFDRVLMEAVTDAAGLLMF